VKRKFKGGLTSVSLPVFIADTSSTTGGGLSGVTSASSGLVLEYRRSGQSTWTSVTPQAGKTLGSYLSGGIVADGSLSGAYEVDFPDAAFASGASVVLCRIRGVTNMLSVLIEIELDAVDYQDSVRFGLTSIPNVAQGTNGALPTGNASGQVTVATLTAGAIQSFWDALTSGLSAAGSIGKWILDNLNATVSSRATQTSVDAIPTTPLLSTDPRLANLDFAISTVNTNILNLNNLSAKMNLFGSPLLEIPEAGTTVYAFTLVVKDDEDKLVNLDASPTLAAVNAAGTSRSGNLSAVSNPSTGRYTFTYSVPSTHASESLRITVSGAVSSEARYIEWVGSVVNYDSLTVLQLVQSTVNAIDTRLPASPAAVGNIPTAATIRDTIMNSMPGGGWVNGSFGDRWVIGVNNNREVQVTGSNHISADIHAFQNGVLTAAAIAAGALNGKGDWLTTLGASAPVNWINAGSIADGAIDAGSIADGALNGKGNWLTSLGANAPAGWINAASITTDAITGDKIAASAVTKITVNLFKYGDIQRWNSPANQIDVTITKV
jgi:hypothetical protein